MLIFSYFVGVCVGANKCCCQWGNFAEEAVLNTDVFFSFHRLRRSIFMSSRHRERSPAHARRQICETLCFTAVFNACKRAVELLNTPSRLEDFKKC